MVPNARVVRDGIRPMPRLVIGPGLRDRLEKLQPQARDALATVIGLWPLLVTLGFGAIMLWAAGTPEP